MQERFKRKILSALDTLGADRGARLVFGFGRGVNPKILKVTTGENEHGNGH